MEFVRARGVERLGPGQLPAPLAGRGTARFRTESTEGDGEHGEEARIWSPRRAAGRGHSRGTSPGPGTCLGPHPGRWGTAVHHPSLLRVLRLPPCSPCETLPSGRAGPGRSGTGQDAGRHPRSPDPGTDIPSRPRAFGPRKPGGFPANRLAPAGILPPASPRRPAVPLCPRRPVEIDVMHTLAPSGTPLGSRRRQ